MIPIRKQRKMFTALFKFFQIDLIKIKIVQKFNMFFKGVFSQPTERGFEPRIFEQFSRP